MIPSIRYRGGLYASGTGIDPLFVKALDSSSFLAIDVVLNHLLSLPCVRHKERSVSADLFMYKNRDPEIYCRIYGTLMSGLARQPQYFDRWFNDEFNLLQEFFSACVDIQRPSALPEDPHVSDLCWQYASTLAEALYRSALQIVKSMESSQSGAICPSTASLDRLGYLLARLIVFLTPKQQVTASV
ncbi:unnamed protein product [Echinostoma caproni]|uniref:Aamy domain-containing protein n=1 Tax=Echinostoma caproni TaxID=27848 RepID=A0A183BDU6_9TREM|nr:unnamed protein product [Echinostoma caproni]